MDAYQPLGADPTVAELLARRPHLSMRVAGGLLLEGVPLAAIADALGTPTWVIGAGTLRARARRLRAALDDAGLDAAVHYAVKANDHLAVLRILSAEGFGADVVSGGELRRARMAGIAGSRIVFSGVGKSAGELRLAIGEGVGQINVESAEEIELLSRIAGTMGRRVAVALRVNPDIDAGGHTKIATGRASDKFGIAYGDALALYARAAALPGLEPVGLAVHIGSQIAAPTPFRQAFARIAALVVGLRESGHAVRTVDCGGGLGVSYRDEDEGSPRALAGAMRATLGDLGLLLVVEPGRWLVAPAGLLLGSVVLVKRQGAGEPPFIVLDCAMNDLLRPSLYEAWHGLLPLSASRASAAPRGAHVVGPVCESGDSFARDRMLPPLQVGDRVAILDTGAYGAVMSSTYNARPLAAQALVDGTRWTTIRPRQEISALWRDEIVPDWIMPRRVGA
ncbi:diaminopimelate decarboxylase [Lichenicoccus sp.]|uniref:diaminopimelate decarboxylase n=1 Tax=Lichenicoccus sp. TaxID=2781899 RepID=UPI003D11F202